MLYVEETLVTSENLMMIGERSKTSDTQTLGVLLPLFVATDLLNRISCVSEFQGMNLSKDNVYKTF